MSTTKRKRPRKQDDEAAQKAALRQRLHDFMVGSVGGGFFDGTDEYTFLGNNAECVSRFLCAIRHEFGFEVGRR